MKKKSNAKDRRNKSQEKRNSVITAKAAAALNQKAIDEEKRIADEEAARLQKQVELIESKNEDLRKRSKSGSKAAGLKSTFTIDKEHILMTSFGRGNDAVLDKHISANAVADASEEAKLGVEIHDKKFDVSGRVKKHAEADNPLYSKRQAGEDVIHCKDKLETMFFGRTFEDNIHIQLIYNILDIEKILTVQVNNVVYALDNILRRSGDENDDFIGSLSIDRASYEKFSAPSNENQKKLYNTFCELLNQPQMGYFGNVMVPEKKHKGKEYIDFERKCYHLLAVIGTLRQATAHGDENIRSKIYTIGAEHDKNFKEKGCRIEARQELDKLYNGRISELNRDFLKTSNKDIFIMLKAMDAASEEEKKKLIRDYYGFVILKSFKNTGYSIKRLRELIIERKAQHFGSDQYATFRKKLYRIIDFAIYEYYTSRENADKAESLVERLRASEKASEKEAVYSLEIESLWPAIKKSADEALCWMNEGKIKEIGDPKYDKAIIEDITFKESADPFCEMIYLITLFLDGKEINDMLTQLINRFDNIRSFIDVLNAEDLCSEFTDKYTLFSRSSDIVEELKVINSFARMTSEEQSTKKVMFEEAAQILGYYDDGLEDFISSILDKNSDYYEARGSNFRNFIINNVLESTRFKYLVRYGNPEKLKAVTNNRVVVDFVLKDIPDEQVCAYYNSCNGVKEGYNEGMRSDLAEKITGLSFMDFENVVNKSENPDKEKKKNIVRLYLTVIYLLLKNLIYVNSRYYLAFHCAERDAMTYDSNKYNADVLKKDWSIFAKDFIVTYPPRNPRVREYLKDNFSHSDAWSLNQFRNCAEHLSAIRNIDKYIGDIKSFNSYFELYHYLVQRSVIDAFENMHRTEDIAEGKLLEYFGKVKKYNTYCMDFVKALNVPFAYNLARYKNLSIEGLFDRNNYNTKEGKL